MKGVVVAFAMSTFVLLAVQTLRAQEGAAARPDAKSADPTITSWTNEKIDNPPAREIKFEVAKTLERRKLFRADAKLLEHEYVAQVRLQLPKPRKDLSSQRIVFDDAQLRELAYFGNRFILMAQRRPSTTRTQAESLKAYQERMPKEQLEKLNDKEFFASEDVDRGYLSFDFQSRNQLIAEFHILSRTQEEAERRAQDLLTLLDQAVTRPVQRILLEKHTQAAEQYREERASLLQVESDYERLDKELTKYSGPAGTVDSVQLQRFQLDVDLAGVEARLSACDARLKADVTPEQRTQLEGLKLSAEIDLAGCEARRVVLDKHLEQVTRRYQAAADRSKTHMLVQQHQNAASSTRRMLNELKQELDEYQPLPLVDGKVILQPVEWTQ